MLLAGAGSSGTEGLAGGKKPDSKSKAFLPDSCLPALGWRPEWCGVTAVITGQSCLERWLGKVVQVGVKHSKELQGCFWTGSSWGWRPEVWRRLPQRIPDLAGQT